MTTTWANDTERFWASTSCDGLFLLFDTSAHIHDGTPKVDSDEVIEHVRDCEKCQENDVRVSILTDGTEELEGYEIA